MTAGVAVAVGVGSTAADVVTGTTGFVALVVRPISSRVAASTIHDSGESAGAVGELPANGLSNALTTCDIAVVTVATGADGCCFGVATITLAVVLTGETITWADGVAVTAGTAGSPTATVCAVVFGCTAIVGVEAVFGAESCVVFVVCWAVWGVWEVCGFFFFLGVWSAVVVLVSLEAVVALVVLLGLEDVPEVSANATPCPAKIAAPIPSATANPPIRPTYTPAPMTMCIPSARASVCGFDESVGIASRG